MADQVVRSSPRDLFIGFVLVAAALVVGNIVAVVLTSIWGWENLNFDHPGGVALGAVQGAVGALIAFWACEKWATVRVAELWLAAALWLAGLCIVALIALTLWSHRLDLLWTWNTAALIAYLTAIFLVRRSASDSFR